MKTLGVGLFLLLVSLVLTQTNPGELLNGRSYQGSYTASQSSPTFDYLDNHKGLLKLTLFSSSNGPYLNSLSLILLDPSYSDEKVVILQIKEIIDLSSGQWNKNDHRISCATFWKNNQQDSYEKTNVNSFIQVTGYDNGKYEQVGIMVYLHGDNFQIGAQLQYVDEFWPTFSTSLFLANVAAIELLSSLQFIKKLMGHTLLSYRTSLLTVTICTILDFASIVKIGNQGLNQPQQQAFDFSRLFYLVPLFLYVFLYAIIDFRIMALVWRSHNIDLANQMHLPQTKKSLIKFYLTFLVGLVGYVVSIFFFSNYWWYILGSQLILVPQIIRNARKNCQEQFNVYYIFGYVGVRMLVPIYQRSCPSNRFQLAPNLPLVYGILGSFFIEVGMLYLQFRQGSRCFIPRRFQPNYYNYKCKLTYNGETKHYQCTVCLQNLFQASAQSIGSQLLEQGLNEPLIKDKITVVKTPCGHHFHRECLQKWMEVKMVCPTCRQNLPPF